MGLFRFISVRLSLGLIAGILLGYFLRPALSLPFILVGLGILILGILFVLKRQSYFPFFEIVSALLTISIGTLTFSLSQPENLSDHYCHVSKTENSIWHIKIREVLKSTPFSDRYIAVVRKIDDQSTTGKIMVNVPSGTGMDLLIVDDELLVLGSLKDIKVPLNPHQFNYKNYLNNLGIAGQLTLTDANYFKSISQPHTVYGTAARLREKISSKLRESNFGEVQLGIIKALLLGQRNDILKETWDDYKNAGAVHILAVSGLHIGIILLLLQFLLTPLERFVHGKTVKLVLIVLLLWGFAFLAGLSASVVRAVAMFSFLAYALFLNRPTSTFNILALSMFFILLIHPMFLFQVGFQMSYAAVFAIAWVYPMLQRFWFPKNILLQRGWQLVSVSIAAQLGVLPISLFYFHQFSGLFFVSNLLIVPFLGILLGMGILVIALALLNFLPPLLVDLYDFLIGTMNSLIGWVAGHEAFIFRDIPFDTIELFLGYAIIISLIYLCTEVNYKRSVVLLLAIIGFQLWSYVRLYQTDSKENFLVLHQTGNTVLLHQSGSRLHIFTSDSTRTTHMVLNYKVAENAKDVTYQKLNNGYLWGNNSVLIIDSLGVYPTRVRPNYLLLTQSPRINLDRTLDYLRPKIVIADGNNYRSYIKRWKASCDKANIPFNFTGEDGAFSLELE
ncbi:ComEC family competence protein [Flavobacteriaceae bacterium F89]|uniref:ComEC family competence protein n=1 Tax=Cerina litoralis TaxID=2874477 RepID=A0AAE3JSN8_9FLAO|nr:ComEC/Rec2 family competence protein [Cerina litoralis]MCG2462718.1 ComEC family competence protein [Cerina litoralis]